MTVKPRAAWARLLESLWFVPSAVGLAGLVLAIGMVELSTWVDQDALSRFPRVFGASADSSRSLLSAIGASVITVAGVTFSLTASIARSMRTPGSAYVRSSTSH